jgi:hypothetical protein
MNRTRLLLHAGTFSRLVREGILRDHGVRACHCVGSGTYLWINGSYHIYVHSAVGGV